ncbi:uncharacterized protein LOC111390602 [Olea europaea var. sylvestris]|uniref:uncharacterized protein LOC111390602 n=1 Tax=Olea europaea var. sylvestris TaxID=158386 RepID=UPI000C1D7DA5|nr:uncharacterized protein LOC111390602 [Olea europaea var. sylvestris]
MVEHGYLPRWPDLSSEKMIIKKESGCKIVLMSILFIGLSSGTCPLGLFLSLSSLGKMIRGGHSIAKITDIEWLLYKPCLYCSVAVDKFSGRFRGFGFVSFDEKIAMEEAIEAMNGIDLDGRTITVDKARANQGSGRDYDNDRSRDRDRDRDRGHGRDRDRDLEYGSGQGSGGEGCFKCGKPGHFARECPDEGARSSRYGIGMVAEVVVVMVLIVMEIDLEAVTGILVAVGEVIDIIVIALGLMITEDLGISDVGVLMSDYNLKTLKTWCSWMHVLCGFSLVGMLAKWIIVESVKLGTNSLYISCH